MRRLTKIFNLIYSVKNTYLVLVLLLIPFQKNYAETVDSNFHLLDKLVSIDSTKEIHNYSGNNFCHCTTDQQGPVIPGREVNTAELEQHRKEKDFQYERTVKDETSSFWTNFWNWLMRKLFGDISDESAIKTRNIVFWLLALFAIVIVSYWLYKSEFLGSPMRRTSKINSGLFEETERSEEDIESKIKEALRNNDYPLAIRWVYIRCIKTLSVKNEIDVRQDKTNYDYYLELKNRSLQEPFIQLTRIFEYTNYGNFVTEISNYNQAETIYKIINSKI